MSQLPDDVARCYGRATDERYIEIGCEPECIDCRRRIPGWPNDHLLTHMDPPVFVGGKCPMRIEP